MEIRMQDKHDIITDSAYFVPASVVAAAWDWYIEAGIHNFVTEAIVWLALLAALGRTIYIWKGVFKRKDRPREGTKNGRISER